MPNRVKRLLDIEEGSAHQLTPVDERINVSQQPMNGMSGGVPMFKTKLVVGDHFVWDAML